VLGRTGGSGLRCGLDCAPACSGKIAVTRINVEQKARMAALV
jgi:hypothetical protein